MNTNYDNITPNSEGVFPTQGLKSVNNQQSPDIFSQIAQSKGAISRDLSQSVNVPTYGDESFLFGKEDTDISLLELDQPVQDITLNQIRGEMQPWWSDLGRGIAKAGITAATTAGDVLALPVGLASMATGGEFVDNPLSRVLKNVNDWSEQVLPLYETKEQEESPWYSASNLLSTNFIGDKLIKNSGFILGSAITGGIVSGIASKALRVNKIREAFRGLVASAVTKDPKVAVTAKQVYEAYKSGAPIQGELFINELTKQAAKLRNAELTTRISGSVAASIGEANIEALSAKDDYIKYKEQQLKEYRNSLIQQETDNLIKENPSLFRMSYKDGFFSQIPTVEAAQLIENRVSEKFNIEEALKEVDKQSTNVANAVFGLNMALLSQNNFSILSKSFIKGYNDNKRLTNNIYGSIKDGYTARLSGSEAKSLAAARVAIEEGLIEEMGQSSISRGAQIWQSSKLNEHYKSKIDPNAQDTSISLLNGIYEGILDTYGDVNNWEEFAIGALSGILGVPTIKRNTRDNSRYSIGMAGGVWQDFKEINQKNLESTELANTLTSIVQSNDFIDKLKSLNSMNYFQDKMDKSLAINDIKSYKDAEDSYLFSLIHSFSKAGRLQDLISEIQNLSTIDINSPEQIQSVKDMFRDKQTGKSDFDNMSDEQIVSTIQNNTESLIERINEQDQILRDIETRYGGYTPEQQEELAWMLNQVDRWEKRASEIRDNILEQYNTLTLLKINGEYLFTTIQKDPKIDELINILQSSESGIFDELGELENKYNSLIENIQNNKQDKKYNKYTDTLTNIRDFIEIGNNRNEFLDKFSEYIYNPQELERALQKTELDSSIEQGKNEVNKNNNVVQSLKDIQDKEELKTQISKIESPVQQRLVLKKLSEEEQNPVAKELYDIFDYKEKIESNLPQRSKEITSKILTNLLNKVQTVEELKNPYQLPIDQADFIDIPQESFDSALQDLQDTIKRINTIDSMSNNSSTIKGQPSEVSQQETLTNGLQGEESFDPFFTEEESPTESLNSQSYIQKLIENLNNNENISNEDKGIIREILLELLGKNKPIDFISNSNNFNIKEYEKIVPGITNSEQIENTIKGLINQTSTQLGLTKQDSNLESQSSIKDNKIEEQRNLNSVEIGGDLDTTQQETEKEEIPNKNSLNNYYYSAISEVHNSTRDFNKNGIRIFEPLYKYIPNIETIYKFLQNKGAFRYVNSGKLKVGDKVTFGVDPELLALNTDQDKYFPILIYKGRQVIGILPTKSTYNENLVHPSIWEIIDKIKEDYNKLPQNKKDQVYKSKYYTTVNNIFAGYVPMDVNMQDIEENSDRIKTNRSLVKDKLQKDTPVYIGLYSGGKMQIPNTEGISIILPNDPVTGKLYLYIKGADQVYYPIRVSTSHFTKEEFSTNLNQTQQKIVNSISNELKKIVQIKNNKDDLNTKNSKIFEIKKQLEDILYLEESKIFLNINDKYQYFVLQNQDNTQYVHLATKEGVLKSDEELLQELLDALYNLKLSFKIDKNTLNQGRTNNTLFNSILYTNTLQLQQVNSSFILNPISINQSDSQYSLNFSSKQEDTKSDASMQEQTILGEPVIYDNKQYYVQDNGTVLDSQGNIIDTSPIISDLLWLNKVQNLPTYQDQIIDDRFIKAPSGRYIDIYAREYVEDEKTLETLNKPNQDYNSQAEEIQNESLSLLESLGAEFNYSPENNENEVNKSKESIKNQDNIKETTTFEDLDDSLQKLLLMKGYNNTTWNNLTLEEKKHSIKCINL